MSGKSRKNGEGSIVKRADGRWQVSLQVGGVRRTIYAKNEKDARAKLRALQQQAQDGALPNPDGHTLNDLIDTWLGSAPDLKPSTAAQYRLFFDTYARAALGDARLEKITPDRLQKLYAGLTPSVAAAIHRILHRALAVAVLWRWLPSNPADRVLKPTYKPPRPNLWTAAQMETFLEGTAGHWLNPLWVFLLSSGARLGEALALRWDSIGLGVAATIDSTLHRLGGEWVTTEPKTASANRTILLPPIAIAALTRQNAQQDAWRTAPDWQDTGLIFTGQTGQPLWHSTVQHALKKVCERLDLPPLTPHKLRHLHASLLLGEGVPVTAVSARLGHANPNITMQIYAHALAGQDAQAAQAIDRALAQSSAKVATG